MTGARIPTDSGQFQLYLYQNNIDKKEHLALIMGDITSQQEVLVRIHSECFTGDVLGSLRCDCGQQLSLAMQLIADEGTGIIIYLRQEGRGIGLLNKLHAYNLQDMGHDTVDANLRLGYPVDARDYTIAALILQDLNVSKLRLLTNNPSKIESLQQLGLTVTARVSLQAKVHQDNAVYLATKMKRMRHLLNLESDQVNLNSEVLSLPEALVPGSPVAGRPFVTLSYAQSLNGAITIRRGEPMAISNAESRTMTHKLRANHDAIMVGIDTVLVDNPRLTVREVVGQNPQPIILDSRLRFPLEAKLLQNKTLFPWIASTEQAKLSHQHALEAAGARVLRLPANLDGQVSLAALLSRLYEMGFNSVMVEGGARVITSLLAARLVDRLVVTVAPLLMGGLNAVGTLAQPNSHEFPRLHNPHHQWLGNNMVIFGDVTWSEE